MSLPSPALSLPPLTHHEILGLIEPFARRGRRVDLARSDRLARRLVFEARDHDGAPPHRETLDLDNATAGVFRLVRTLTLADGSVATLSIDGADPGALLAAIESVPHGRQLRTGPGFTMTLGHRLEPAGVLRLTHGAARAGGMSLTLTMPSHRDPRADIALTTRLEDPIELPDDLLAVLGWDWSRLDRWTERTARRWKGSVRIGRRAAQADVDAERKLESAARHVAATLAEPPARFHERAHGARLIFAFRRSIPLLVCVALLVGTLLFTKAGLSQDSIVRMLIFNAPPLMLVAFFCLREIPRIELPRWPRASHAKHWRDPP